jgi:hypothetical protein
MAASCFWRHVHITFRVAEPEARARHLRSSANAVNGRGLGGRSVATGAGNAVLAEGAFRPPIHNQSHHPTQAPPTPPHHHLGEGRDGGEIALGVEPGGGESPWGGAGWWGNRLAVEPGGGESPWWTGRWGNRPWGEAGRRGIALADGAVGPSPWGTGERRANRPWGGAGRTGNGLWLLRPFS